MMNEHYLDNAATTEPSEAALAAMTEALRDWGNPSSVHSLGRAAAKRLSDCRTAAARALGLPRYSADRLIFTSCGTESNNIALLGCARAKKRDPESPGTVLLSAGEHPSLDGPASLLEGEGFTVVRIPTAGGALDLDCLSGALEKAKAEASPVIFAGFMLVNNETGALYDVRSAFSLVKRAFPDAVTHCDAVQGFMKVPFTPASLGADTLTVSAHKIHAPRGAALLYLSAETVKRKNVVAVMPGGGQEGGWRSGTENLPAIAAFAAAAAEGRRSFDEDVRKVEALRARLDERMAALGIPENRPQNSIPHIASIVVPRLRSETVLNALSGQGIYVSAGSACSAHSKKKSAALLAFGVSPDEADSTLRVSLSHTNEQEDVDALADALGEIRNTLQKKR